MPKRLSLKTVKELFRKYGYQLPKGFTYQNNKIYYPMPDLVTNTDVNMSVHRLKQDVSRGNRKPFDYGPKSLVTSKMLMNLPLSSSEIVHKSSFERWVDKQTDYVKHASKHVQEEVYRSMKDIVKRFRKKKNFEVDLKNESHAANIIEGFISAAKIALPSLKDVFIKLTVIDWLGNVEYRYVNAATLDFLQESLLMSKDIDLVIDSSNDFFYHIPDLRVFNVEFENKPPTKSKQAGFFPFINKSDINLRHFGIFESTFDKEINESCLYYAFKESKVLSVNELDVLKSFIITRMVPQTALKEIADVFHVHIKCKKYYEKTGKYSFDEYGTDHERTIDLITYYEHYMLNAEVNASTFYIKNYDKINNDPRFTNHVKKNLLKNCLPKRYKFCKQGINIYKCLKLMIELKLLVPMTDKELTSIEWGFKRSVCLTEGISRPVNVIDKVKRKYRFNNDKVLQTQKFFGYKPDPEEVPVRLNELQEIINKIPLRNPINVSLYYKFSELMQKIMFEYGCYDNVYELSGTVAHDIRSECMFPNRKSEPLYLNQKMYYVDLNGAYMSCVKGIPTGYFNTKPLKEDEHHSSDDNVKINTKIKSLIELLWGFRTDAQSKGNSKLATTLKFLMSSCWGYSIKRPKCVSNKFANDVNKRIETYAPYVLRFNFNSKDTKEGYVSTINAFCPNFTCPQFTKCVLDEFNAKMDEIKSLVKVYYQNIDAIPITESDYHKLKSLGYVGSDLGQFKIEHVFTEFALKGNNQYVATLDNGQKYYHCVNKEINYDDFIDYVKSLI